MSQLEHADWQGPEDRMPEAEVSIRLAEYLSELDGFDGHVDVAIDGASVAVQGAVIFDIASYMRTYGWSLIAGSSTGKNAWAATYGRNGATMKVHSHPGKGDVVASIGGRKVIAECKKGPLIMKVGSPELPLLYAALGQAILFNADEDDIVIAAVPDTSRFQRIAADWRERPRLKRAGIQIVLVSRTGAVSGLVL